MQSEFADELFEKFNLNAPGYGLSYSFSTIEDLNNIESLQRWIEDHDLGDFVLSDDGTLATLAHPNYDFKLDLSSYGLGDFFTHGIGIEVSEME